jgi:hypothetical protein
MTGQRPPVRSFAPAVFAVCFAAAACRHSPGLAYARQLERAASWASSVAFTAELAQQRRVPARFVDDAMTTAAKELKTIQADIAARNEVNESARRQAADWCRRLDQLIEESVVSRSLSGTGEIREIEQRLRAAARDARAGVTPESRP